MGEGRLRPQRQLRSFKETIDYYQLYDLGFAENKYTWCNQREDKASISERVDRFLTDGKWKQHNACWG